MPGFVDPRPGRDAEVRRKRAELGAAVDDAERHRLETELAHLEGTARHGHSRLHRLLLGLGHRAVPW